MTNTHARHAFTALRLALIGASAIPVSLYAQTPAANADDIIVTARRNSESMMQVPVAVTALNTAAIDRYAATDLTRIAQLNPQVEFQKGGSGAGATFLIRGIGSSAADPGLEQTVAVNIDGVLVSRGRILDQGMFDIQQVEILKGPQALFFGKNSPAGVVSITSANPTDRLEGYARAGYEFNADQRFLEGAISGPLTNTLKVRLAGRVDQMDGWIKNVAVARVDPADPTNMIPGAYSDAAPASRSFSGRLTMIWEPTSDFTSTLKVLAGRRTEKGDANVETICAAGIANPVILGRVDLQNDCLFNRERAATAMSTKRAAGSSNPSGLPFSRQTNILVSWNNRISFGAFDITSITGYVRLDKKGRDSSPASSFDAPFGGADELSKQFSEELRLNGDIMDGLGITIGAYYERSTRAQFAELNLNYYPADPATGRYGTSDKTGFARNRTYSAFGQLRWKILPELELAGGARWTKEEKSARQQNSFVNAIVAANFRVAGSDLVSDYSGDNVSPEATLTWRPDANNTLYGAFKTGYKSGGIANPIILTRADTDTSVLFGPEKARGGEVGYKGRLFDRKLRVELVAYRYTFKGLQTSSFDNVLLRYILRNAASARTTGVEASADLNVTSELSLRGSMGYNRAKFLSFPGAPCYAGQSVAQGCSGGQQDLSGKQLYRAPKLSFTLGAGYDAPITSDLKIGLSADTRFTSHYIAQENYNPVSLQNSYWLVNAGARIYSEDAGWELALVGRNLNNVNVIGFSTDQPGGGPGQIAAVGSRPREFLVQGTFRF